MEETVMVSQVMDNSRIPGGYGGAITPIRSSERARELNAIRWERARQRAAAALRDGAGDGKSTMLGWYRGTLAQVEKMLKGDTRAFHAVGKAAGLFRENDQTGAQVGQGSGEAAEIVALYRAAVADNPELQARARQLLARQTSESE